jgi:hypothetical protein
MKLLDSDTPVISWMPNSTGNYYIAAFLWEGIDHPKPLANPQEVTIDVR